MGGYSASTITLSESLGYGGARHPQFALPFLWHLVSEQRYRSMVLSPSDSLTEHVRFAIP